MSNWKTIKEKVKQKIKQLTGFNFISKLADYIKKSCFDHTNKLSSNRIQSYIILTLIYLMAIVYLGVDIGNAINLWFEKDAMIYEIPNQHVVIYGMILAHHFSVLFRKDKNLNSYHDKTKEILTQNKTQSKSTKKEADQMIKS